MYVKPSCVVHKSFSISSTQLNSHQLLSTIIQTTNTLITLPTFLITITMRFAAVIAALAVTATALPASSMKEAEASLGKRRSRCLGIQAGKTSC